MAPDLLSAPARGSGRPTRCRRQRPSRATPAGSTNIGSIQPTPFDVRVEPWRGRLLVVPTGELDLHTAERMQAAMREQLASGSHVVADLRELTFIDSSGIRVLWEAHTYAEHDGARFSVIPGHDPVRRALGLTGLLERLHILE